MPKTFVLTQEMRHLLEEHQKCKASLVAERRRPAPNPDVMTVLKRKKLAIKDRMIMLAGALPPSQYAPINPMLYPLTDEELQKRLRDVERDCRRTESTYGSTASELAKVKADLRSLEIEIDRRAWDAATAESDEQLEAA
jgi:hypothetical protein